MEQKKRYFLEISYKGTAYHGWQIQPNAVSVQEVIQKALSTFLREQIDTTGCGRTDTGVHATQFYLHFDCSPISEFSLRKTQLLTGINALLPFDIAAKRIIEVEAEAHARFDATQRSYQYHIHRFKDPFKINFSWLLKDALDIEKMNEAAAVLLNYSDFSCFSKSHTQVFTNNCTISKAMWQHNEEGLIFHISADRFLRNMVRAIVGTLLEIGKAKLPPDAIHEIIQSKNRSSAGTSVPACGLYLTEVKYPFL